jgi:hypothetical protein
MTLATGQRSGFNAVPAPLNAQVYTDITWSSSNPSVATVNERGVVTAVAAGTAIITAAMYSGGQTFSAQSTVTVSGGTLAICGECGFAQSDCKCCTACRAFACVCVNHVFISAVDSVQNGGWFEIHNPTGAAISARGLYVSNGNERWRLPAVILREGMTVRVRAVNNDVTPTLRHMQASFGLRAGDTLRLTDSSGQVLSVVDVV